MLFRLRYFFQDRGKELLKLYPEYSRTSLYRHAVKSIDSTQVVDKSNKGRLNKVSLRGGKNYFARNTQIMGII